jgi:acylphosphatase
MEAVAKHIVFTGRVQGVGFRFTVLNIANRYQLTGYVRNASNGSVEVLAQGQPESIDSLLRDIEESFTGYIRQTDVKPVEVNPSLTGFRITF